MAWPPHRLAWPTCEVARSQFYGWGEGVPTPSPLRQGSLCHPSLPSPTNFLNSIYFFIQFLFHQNSMVSIIQLVGFQSLPWFDVTPADKKWLFLVVYFHIPPPASRRNVVPGANTPQRWAAFPTPPNAHGGPFRLPNIPKVVVHRADQRAWSPGQQTGRASRDSLAHLDSGVPRRRFALPGRSAAHASGGASLSPRPP